MPLQVSEEARRAVYEAAWNSGDLLPTTFADMPTSAEANETFCEFLRDKIRSIVKDPATAEALCPTGYYYGTKRPCLDSGYFETFNLPARPAGGPAQDADYHDHRDGHQDHAASRWSSTPSCSPPASTR